MNKGLFKLLGLSLGLSLAVGAGVALSSGGAKHVKAADTELTFDFSSNPGGWPTANSAGNYDYTLDGTKYSFALGANVYCNSGYLMLKYTTSLGLPAISDKTLTKVVAHNSSGCSTSTRVGVSSLSSSASYVSGGSYQTYSSTDSDYTYNLSGTSANTMYYLYITNKNCQITSLSLTYSSDSGNTSSESSASASSEGSVSSESSASSASSASSSAAVQTYTVTYNSNGGSGTMTDSNSPYATGSSVTVKENTFTIASGWEFDKWNTKADGTGTEYTAGASFDITENTTLYAQWKLSGSEPTGNVTIAYSGTTTNMSGNNDAASLGVSATDWDIKGYKGSHDLFPGLNKDGTIRLYYNSNGSNYLCVNTLVDLRIITRIDVATSSNANIAVYSGDQTTSGTAISNVNGAYSFGNGTSAFTIINATTSTVSISSIKVYYIDPLKVTYDGNDSTGGSVPTDATNYSNGDSVTVKSNSGNLVKTGYTFGGWNTKDDGTGTNYAAGSGQFNISESVTLYAKWNINSYTVSFNMQGHGSAPANQTVQYQGKVAEPSAPTETGYGFGGWYKEAACTNAWVFSTDTIGAADTVLYAKWTINSYAVSDELLIHGHLYNTDSIEHGGDLVVTIVPDTGYTFPDTIKVTMGGSDITASVDYDKTDGTIMYEGVTDEISVEGECAALSTVYDINVSYEHCTVSAPSDMLEDGDAEITITPAEGYKLPSAAVVSAVTYISVENAIDWDYSDGVITILGAKGDVNVTIDCPALENYQITLNLTNGTKQSGPTSVLEGSSATIVILNADGYGQPDTVDVTGATGSWTKATGTLVLTNPTGPISVTYSAKENALESIVLSSTSGSYTLGDEFDLPTVTAKFSVADDDDVTDDVTVTCDTLVNNLFTETGVKSVKISYSYNNHTEEATYTATVTAIVESSAEYVKVTSAPTDWSGTYLIVDEGSSRVMDGSSKTNNGAYQGVTISNSIIAATETINSYAYVIAKGTTDTSKYTVKSASGYYIDRPSSGSGGSLTVSNSEAYELSLAYNTDHTEIRASCYASSGQNKQQLLQYNNSSSIFKFYNSTQRHIQLYKFNPAVSKTLKWITAEAKSGTYYQDSSVTADDFTVTAHYDDGSHPIVTTDITVTNNTLSVVGVNYVTISYGGKTCTAPVTAVEQTATLTGLSWAQGEYVIIDGQTIDFSKLGVVTASYDVAPSSTKSIASCTVSTYSKSGDVYTLVDGLNDGDEITSAMDGLYLGVSYQEKTVTKVAYSSKPISVVEAIEDVYPQSKVTSWSSVTSLEVGDVVTFVNEKASKVASGATTNTISVSEYSGSVSTDFSFVVGKVGSYYTFHNENGYLGNHSTGTSGNNYAYLDAEIDTETNMNYFTVSFDEGDVVITSVYDNARKLQFNSSRFCFYGSSQSSVQLYKGTEHYVPSGDSIANTNAVAQRAVLEFAEHFNDVMECVNGGTTANVASKWSDLAEDFGNWFELNGDKDLTAAQIEDAFALFKNAYAVEDGDTLQDMLARYEYICAKYELDDFIAEATNRPSTSGRSKSSPVVVFGTDAAATPAIFVIVSLASITAVGGYLFIRRRNEQ